MRPQVGLTTPAAEPYQAHPAATRPDEAAGVQEAGALGELSDGQQDERHQDGPKTAISTALVLSAAKVM